MQPSSIFSKFLCTIVTLMTGVPAHAFVIIDPDYRLSNPENTVVNISQGSCSGISDAELEQAIKDCIDEYWNTISESRLKLKYGGIVTDSVSNPAPSGTVLVGCQPLSGASGVAIPNVANGSAVVQLDSNSFVPGGYLYDGLIHVLSHELGHAVGLAHSDDPASVMTYQSNGWSPRGSFLSQDDKDGVAYLYPHKQNLGGLLGGCGTEVQAATGNHSAQKIGWGLPLVGLILLLFRLKSLRNSKSNYLK